MEIGVRCFQADVMFLVVEGRPSPLETVSSGIAIS